MHACEGEGRGTKECQAKAKENIPHVVGAGTVLQQ